MLLEMRTPCPALQPFIRQYVYHEGYIPPHTRERVLAYETIDLIIDLSETPKYTFDKDSLQSKNHYRHGWVSGLRCEPIIIECGSGAPMLVISFKPGGAWAFFGFPVSELSYHIEEAESIWGRAYRELRERLMGVSGHTRFAVLEAWLLQLAGDRLNPDPYVGHALQLIGGMDGPPGMRRLADQLGFSQKHMITLFDKMVGLSPKRFARISRFQKMVHALEAGKPVSWSSFAQDFGFYDQAHFNNEFKAFSGLSPQRYMALKGPFLNFVPQTTR